MSMLSSNNWQSNQKKILHAKRTTTKQQNQKKATQTIYKDINPDLEHASRNTKPQKNNSLKG